MECHAMSIIQTPPSTACPCGKYRLLITNYQGGRQDRELDREDNFFVHNRIMDIESRYSEKNASRNPGLLSVTDRCLQNHGKSAPGLYMRLIVVHIHNRNGIDIPKCQHHHYKLRTFCSTGAGSAIRRQGGPFNRKAYCYLLYRNTPP